MKCTYLCFGFNDFSRKINWKEVIGRESLSRVLASGNSSVIIIALLVNNGAKYGASWFISLIRYSMTLRVLKISLKKEVHWWCNLFFFWWCHQQSGFWVTNYTPVTWASQLLHWSSSFHDGYWWSRFQLRVMSGTWDTIGESYMFLNWNYCYLSCSVLLLSWSNSHDKKHKKATTLKKWQPKI